MSSNFTGNSNNFLRTDYIIPEEQSEKDLMLRRYLNDLAMATNSKDSGFYDAVEVITGQQFLPTFSSEASSNIVYRDVLRKVIDTGALPNSTTKSVAHGITTTENFSLVRMYGSATDPGASTWTSVLPLPYASSTAANNIELNADATNINIITGSNRSGFTRSFVVIEWITTV